MFLRSFAVLLPLTLLMWTAPIAAQSAPVEVCPGGSIQPRPAEFQPSGLILTTFDRDALWVYNIATDSRYPLPETVPCGRNCHISPDSQWILRMGADFNYYKMRLDGTQRTLLVGGAAEVRWWDPETLLVWTPDHRAFLLPDGAPNTTDQRTYLNVRGVVAVQPGGRHALTIQQNGDGRFERVLENLDLRELVGVAGAAPVTLGEDTPYANDAAWSPDGAQLAFVQPLQADNGATTSELYGVRPGDSTPSRWTDLTTSYGPVRVNGHAIGDLSWSPDSTQVAFWSMPRGDGGPDTDGAARVHIYDTRDASLRAYCGFTTTEHTPTPPRLVWSPDGTHIAFGGNVPNDDKGYLLLALNTSDGTLTELSSGIYPALGAADVIAWGNP
jgi:dipeptidyl aminopeptidase/acylaminoacyl peptidase